MHTKIFVFNHYAASLWQPLGDKNCLILILGRSGEPLTQFRLLSIFSNRKAKNRANINAGIAFDTKFLIEDGLYVAVETALNFDYRLLAGKSKLDFDIEFVEPFLQVNMLHLTPR